MRLSLFFRIAVLIGLVMLGVAGTAWPRLAAFPAAASPLVALAALCGGIGRQTLAGLSPCLFAALVVAIPCFASRRVLCRWFCPLGLCWETVGKLRKRALGHASSPAATRFFRRCPRLGLPLAALICLCCGFGLAGLLWLDPFVLFGTLFRRETPAFYVLALVTLLACFVPTFWCRCLCPLGGTQDLLFMPRRLFLRGRPAPVHTDVRATSRHRMFRRRYLRRGLVFSGWAALFGYLFHRGRTLVAALRLRPPGAIAEPFFSALCCRCGACVQACPTRILKPERSLGVSGGLDRYATPTLVVGPGWCRDDCNACSQVCPSGAIASFTPEEKANLPIGQAVVTFEHCRLYDDVECSVCARECPYEAVDYVWNEEEYRRIVHINLEKCTGCGRCVVTCPVVREGLPAPLAVVPGNVCDVSES